MKSKIKAALLGLAAMTLASLVESAPSSVSVDHSAAAVRQKSSESSGAPFDRAAALERRAETHRWLMSEMVKEGRARPLVAEVDAATAAAIDESGLRERPPKVGLTRAVSASIDFSGVRIADLKGGAVRLPFGAISGSKDGGYVFTMALSSPGAAAVRVHFTHFRLPAQSAVYLYTEDGQVFGPYSGRGPLGDGEFWSHSVIGNAVTLQLHQIGDTSNEKLHGTGFNIAGVGHIRPVFMAGTCLGNASCVENAECVSDEEAPAITAVRNAIAHMEWISGPWIYMCTGGLLADTDESSQIPYFLSANHCISRGKDARSLENFFQFTKPCNSGSCPSIYYLRDHWGQELRTLGATILSTGSKADYTLFKLNDPAPAGSTFLGWNATPVAFSNGTELHRISHPGGSPQSYSAHTVDTFATTCQSWPRGDRIYSRDVVGATEGGSSGSPVVNAAGEVVGQLSGACGYNLDEVCDSQSNATVDGAFAAYFDNVSQYLDPAPTSCTTTETACSDGIDNDCDGAIDADDSDCPSPTSGDGGKGDACTVDSDCASNSCKGKPGAKTCK